MKLGPVVFETEKGDAWGHNTILVWTA